jgi:hypothetical protein
MPISVAKVPTRWAWIIKQLERLADAIEREQVPGSSSR